MFNTDRQDVIDSGTGVTVPTDNPPDLNPLPEAEEQSIEQAFDKAIGESFEDSVVDDDEDDCEDDYPDPDRAFFGDDGLDDGDEEDGISG